MNEEEDENHKGGPGPWFCALYFNLADAKGTKKQTDLRVHTYPLLFEHVLNGSRVAASCQGWIIIMMVGYFERWRDAVAYHTLWASQTRGKFRRIQRGLDLFHTYAHAYNLRLWIQPLGTHTHTHTSPEGLSTHVLFFIPEREQAIIAWTQSRNTVAGEHSMDVADGNMLEALFADKTLGLNAIHQTQQQRKKQK